MKVLSAEQKAVFADRCAVKRWAEPPELGPAALPLAGDAGSYITGSVMVVDGGATARLF
jgi:gluconate 5-dehydrogenase